MKFFFMQYSPGHRIDPPLDYIVFLCHNALNLFSRSATATKENKLKEGKPIEQNKKSEIMRVRKVRFVRMEANRKSLGRHRHWVYNYLLIWNQFIPFEPFNNVVHEY